MVWRLWRQSSDNLSPSVRRVVDATFDGGLLDSCVKIRQSHEVDVPVCVGIVRRRVLLPIDVEDWSREDLRCAIEHEYTHTVRHDLFWSTLTELLVCIHWPNPLIWLFRRLLKQDIESACDDGVLAHGNDSGAYAEMLLGMARRIGGQCRGRTAAISMADRTGFRERVERIIDTTRDRRPASPLAAAVIAVLAIAVTSLVLAVRPGLAEPPSAATDTSVHEQSPAGQSSAPSEGPLRFGSQGHVAGKVTIASVKWLSATDAFQTGELEGVDAVLALDPTSAVRLAKRFESLRPRDRPRLYSIGLTRNVLAKLERAQLDATVSRQPYGLGYRGIEMLVRSRMELLPRNSPPRLVIPASVVTTNQAGYFAGKLRDGQKLTMDNRLVDANLTLRLQIPTPSDPEHKDWWQLVADGANDAAEQFGATLEVIPAAESDSSAIDVIGFASDPNVLAFPVSPDLGDNISASYLVSDDHPIESLFVLKTSVERIADETARLIVRGHGESVTLAIVCHEDLKPYPESFLPILAETLRELE